MAQLKIPPRRRRAHHRAVDLVFRDQSRRRAPRVNWDKEPYWSYGWVDVVVEALSRRHPTVAESDTKNAVGERIWLGSVGGIAVKIDLDGSFGIEITTQIPEEVRALEVIEKSLRRELTKGTS